LRKVALLLALLLAADGRAEAAELRAGFARIALADPVSGKEMSGFVLYPTEAPEHSLSMRPYELEVAEGAAVAGGPYPLVIFSHGRRGLPQSYHDLLGALARRGFIVAAIAHPGDNYNDRSGADGDAELVQRTRHVVALIDYLLREGPFAGAIDASRIGVMGHSAGGYAALLLLGARPDFSQLAGRCRGSPNRPPGAARLTHDPAERPVSDKRIGAAVIMAPAFGCLFDAAALEHIAAPLRFYQGSTDEILSPKFRADYLAPLLPKAPELVNLEGAGHFVFLAPCPMMMRIFASAVCSDAPGIDRATLHARMGVEIAEFFSRTLGRP
jgi:predicted dienelactone hydrolase